MPPDSEEKDGLLLPPGARRVRLRAGLPPGVQAEVRVEVETEEQGWQELGKQALRGPARPPVAGILARLRLRERPAGLFLAALAIYLAVRLAALPAFPIYFFSDEAIQTVLASDLIRDAFHGYSGELLPTFFPNAGQYNLSVSVYLQVVPTLLGGKSIWLTRGIPALVSLLAALALGLALRGAYGSQRAWLGVLALSAAPVWFLHSRTAFETSLATTFYAVFLAAYLMYRLRDPHYLFLAVIAAALACYSYTPAQLITAASGFLFLLSDLPYHWKQRKTVLVAAGLGLLLLIPYIRYQALYPGADSRHLAILGSYWTSSMPLGEKLVTGLGIYLHGLNPLYWFLPHEQDLARHTMRGWGHLLPWTLPFFLTGLILALRSIKQPGMRIPLLALLAAPLGAVPVGPGVTRVLIYAVPAALLVALGMDAWIEWLAAPRLPGLSWPRWLRDIPRPLAWSLPAELTATASYLALGGASLLLLSSALTSGPTWYSDYALTGMQYGARQVFGAIQEQLRQDPGEAIILSPTWANATDVVARYFLGDPLPIQLNGPQAYTAAYNPIPDNALFILPAYEYNNLPRDKFATVEVKRILYYPNGQPGFYFLRLAYVANIQTILADEDVKRHLPVKETVDIQGQKVASTHTRFDIGTLQNALDGDLETLVRTEQINPMEIELVFPAPLHLKGLSLKVGGVATTARVEVIPAGETEPRSFTVKLDQDPNPRKAVFDFGQELEVQVLRIQILNTNDPPDGNVHLWEIQWIEK